jgi:hypothetical protein
MAVCMVELHLTRPVTNDNTRKTNSVGIVELLRQVYRPTALFSVSA